MIVRCTRERYNEVLSTVLVQHRTTVSYCAVVDSFDVVEVYCMYFLAGRTLKYKCSTVLVPRSVCGTIKSVSDGRWRDERWLGQILARQLGSAGAVGELRINWGNIPAHVEPASRASRSPLSPSITPSLSPVPGPFPIGRFRSSLGPLLAPIPIRCRIAPICPSENVVPTPESVRTRRGEEKSGKESKERSRDPPNWERNDEKGTKKKKNRRNKQNTRVKKVPT